MKIQLSGNAFFVRKPSNINELSNITNSNNSFSGMPYIIVGIVYLEAIDYIDFTNCLIGKNYSFLKPYSNLMYDDGIVHCVLVTIEENLTSGILVNSEGTLYGKYCAIWKI